MAIHLVRHGSAGRRASTDDDLRRHLDTTGHQQADGLSRFFASHPVRAVWSSVATRCVETVEPLAVIHGLEIETFTELTEGARPSDLVDLVRSQAPVPGDLVMCSHGDLIPDIVAALAREGAVLTGPRGCEKASVWSLQTQGNAIVRAGYEPSPWITDRQ